MRKKSFDSKFKFVKLAAQQANRKKSSSEKVNIKRVGKNLQEFKKNIEKMGE